MMNTLELLLGDLYNSSVHLKALQIFKSSKEKSLPCYCGIESDLRVSVLVTKDKFFLAISFTREMNCSGNAQLNKIEPKRQNNN